MADPYEEEFFLEFADESTKQSEINSRVSKALEQFTFDEILSMNEYDEEEVLKWLYGESFIGLPEAIDYENGNEEVSDLQDEEILDPSFDD